MTQTVTLRVANIRTQHPNRGCIFTGRQLDDTGNVIDAKSYYVVRAPHRLLNGAQVQRGQWWQVTGSSRQQSLSVNGYMLTEWEVEPSAMELLLPSGEHIVMLLAENADFRGIGRVKAQKLWDTFRDDLYRVLDDGEVTALTEVLNAEVARDLVITWKQLGNSRALQWLQRNNIEVAIGRKVLAFFGAETQAKLEEDPYRLLSFCADWAQVDALARNTFHVAEDDPRRLQGAIEEALYRIFGAGHTVASQAMVISELSPLLGHGMPNAVWRDLVMKSLSQGQSNGSYVVDAQGNLHPIGPYSMEKMAAQAIAERLLKLTAPLANAKQIRHVITKFETQEQLLLNAEQRAAVELASTHAFMLVTGGAGVGKTTVLKALNQLYDLAGLPVVQLALAGRAAMRMQDATGRSATTIASFLQRTSQHGALSGPLVVIVDEASMLDIITLHRLLSTLPSTTRIVLVGDPVQLMPVGPGLVLHALVEVAQVPRAELKLVKRHGGSIAAAAKDIRHGRWPVISNNTADHIAVIPCPLHEIGPQLVALYGEAPERTQILACRRQQADGTETINALCQQEFSRDAAPLLTWSQEQQAMIATGFHVGDPVLCIRNLWALGLQNGSLGRLTEVEVNPHWLVDEHGQEVGYLIGWAEWDDGVRRPIFDGMLEDLVLGYAITAHKAQGSQWSRVLVAVSGNRVLDRTLLYTAITRAQQQVILVGDLGAAQRATAASPKAATRQVWLGQLVSSMIAKNA